MARSHKRGAPAPATGGSRDEDKRGGGRDAHSGLSNEQVKDVAAAGASDAGTDMPYLDQIQASFGEYDVSGIRAHVDAQATEQLGANAYTQGADAVFHDSAPGLRTAAEEATHAIVQGAGRGPQGAGAEGDNFEVHADQVADRVVRGQSAVDLLDRMTGGQHAVSVGREHGVQREAARAPERKEVSGKAMGRLMAAQMGIEHTKKIFEHGGGNQKSALEATDFNSYFRMQAMRKGEFWQGTPEAIELAQANPQALTYAKAQHAQGGNCGEHAAVAYDYLRRNLGGALVNQVAVSGLDHAFVIIGDLEKDEPGDLVVCDPWPTKAIACLWEDHFAYTPDSSKLEIAASVIDDTTDYAAQISEGLTFTEAGQEFIQQTLTEEQMKEEFDRDDERGQTEGESRWIWDHTDAHASDKKDLQYRMPEGVKADSSAYTGTMMEDIRAWMQRGQAVRQQGS